MTQAWRKRFASAYRTRLKGQLHFPTPERAQTVANQLQAGATGTVFDVHWDRVMPEVWTAGCCLRLDWFGGTPFGAWRDTHTRLAELTHDAVHGMVVILGEKNQHPTVVLEVLPILPQAVGMNDRHARVLNAAWGGIWCEEAEVNAHLEDLPALAQVYWAVEDWTIRERIVDTFSTLCPPGTLSPEAIRIYRDVWHAPLPEHPDAEDLYQNDGFWGAHAFLFWRYFPEVAHPHADHFDGTMEHEDHVASRELLRPFLMAKLQQERAFRDA